MTEPQESYNGLPQELDSWLALAATSALSVFSGLGCCLLPAQVRKMRGLAEFLQEFNFDGAEDAVQDTLSGSKFRQT